MNLHDLGEFPFIQNLNDILDQSLPSNITGIGDDAAVIPVSKSKSLLVTTDALAQDTHFTLDKTPPTTLGYKSIAVNASDIAAMGGTPEYVFLAISSPPSTPVSWLNQFIQGIKDACDQFNILLLGGDTTKSSSIHITVTAIGSSHPNHIKLRSNAKANDFICLSSPIGDSLAGFEALHHNLPFPKLIQNHLSPSPHIHQAQFLSQSPHIHSMIDLSDGLNSDLTHILQASSLSANIELSHIPLSPDLVQFCKEYKKDPITYALSSGEEYSLLFTINPTHFASLSNSYKDRFSTPFYKIGTLATSPTKINYFLNNNPQTPEIYTYEHFKN